jgi:DNA-binding transcriptional LysR family regulator
MAIDKLRYFAVVVETRNLRKAAEILAITPGSLSKAIGSLEVELGVKLLRPEGRGIDITDAGLATFQKSIPLLLAHKNFLESVKDKGENPSSALRWGTFEIFSTYFLSHLISQSFKDEPSLVMELVPGEIESALLENRIDLGLTYMPIANPKLEFIQVGKIGLSVWGHSKWQNVEAATWPFAVPITALKHHTLEEHSLDMWPKDVARRVQFRCQMLETALHLARLGQCVVYCPDHLAKLHNKFVRNEFKIEHLDHPGLPKGQKRIKAYLVQRKGFDSSRVEGKLAKLFRSLQA